MTPIDLLNQANQLAPLPISRDMHPDNWTRHYAAQALAAWTAFRDQTDQALGYLALIGEASTAAAIAIDARDRTVSGALWDLTADCGAADGERTEEWLAATLDRCGINPAADFRSPSRAVAR